MELCTDIWLLTLEFLTLRTLANCSVVSSKWNDYVYTALKRKKNIRFEFSDRECITNIELEYKNKLTNNLCKYMINHCKSIEFLDITDTMLDREVFFQLLKTIRNLQFISFSNVYDNSDDPRAHNHVVFRIHPHEEVSMFKLNVKTTVTHLNNYKNLRLLLIDSSIADESVIMIANSMGLRLEGIQLGSLNVELNVSVSSVNYLFRNCPNLKIFFLITSLVTTSNIVNFPSFKCLYLSLPYSYTVDSDCDVISECIPDMIELNIGGDRCTTNALRILSKGCRNLRSICFSLHEGDPIKGIEFISDPNVFPHLERIGIRSPIDRIKEMSLAIAMFKKMRPEVSVFDYHWKRSKGWCFPEFSFQQVAQRAGLL